MRQLDLGSTVAFGSLGNGPGVWEAPIGSRLLAGPIGTPAIATLAALLPDFTIERRLRDANLAVELWPPAVFFCSDVALDIQRNLCQPGTAHPARSRPGGEVGRCDEYGSASFATSGGSLCGHN